MVKNSNGTILNGVLVLVIGAGIVAAGASVVLSEKTSTRVDGIETESAEHKGVHRRLSKKVDNNNDRLIRQEVYLEGLADYFGTNKPEPTPAGGNDG